MDSISPLRRAYLNYLSRAYAVMYSLNNRFFLGMRLAALARWIPLILLAIGWFLRWPAPIMIVLLIAVIWLNYSLWRAKRDNYNRFVADGNATLITTDQHLLPPNQKLLVQATGSFSVSGRGQNLLLRPATYWRVPLGEHVVMVEEIPGKFLYQFFSAQSLQTIRSGWLLFGPRPIESLAITFLARWGPEYTRFGQVYENGNDDDLPPPKKITVYLSTDDPETHQAIWHTIISDARQARLERQ